MTDNTAVTTQPQAKPTRPRRKPPKPDADRAFHDPSAARDLAAEVASEHRRTVELAQDRIVKGLNEQAAELVRLRERLRQKSAAFDRAVALAVSSKPESPDWYDNPGPVPRARVVRCLPGNPSAMTLHRLMERYRKAAVKKGARRK